MKKPDEIVLKYIDNGDIDLKGLYENCQMNFVDYCSQVQDELIGRYTFYSVSNRRFVTDKPTIKIGQEPFLRYEEGELIRIYPDLVKWFRFPRFNKVIISEINNSFSKTGAKTIDLLWIPLDQGYRFLNIKYLI